jgi:hypothetical protein
MHIHLPKPLHGWRQFFGEVGIIVVGVLIALLAEQAVESLHHRHQLRDAEERMTAELRDDDLPQAFARAAIGQCNEDQLNGIESAIAAGDRARVAQLAQAYVPPFRSWDDEAWKAAMASQALMHTDTDRMIAWSAAYAGMPILNQWTTEEQADLARLRSRLSGEGPLSPDQIDRLFGVVGNLRSENAHMSGGSAALLRYAEASGIRPDADKEREILAEARRVYGTCAADPSRAIARKARAYDAAASRQGQ